MKKDKHLELRIYFSVVIVDIHLHLPNILMFQRIAHI